MRTRVIKLAIIKEKIMLPYPILKLGDIEIYMYGVMIALGILACFMVLFEYCKRVGISNKYVDFAFYTGLVAIVIGFIGAAAWQGMFNYIDDLKNGEEAVFSLDGGITAIGGLATGAITYIIICLAFRKKYPFSLTKTVIVAPCCMIIAHAFGRMGCFFAGCCYGKEATGFFSFLGVKFVGHDVYRYPTQLFEAIFLFALFGVLSYLILKKKFKYSLPVYLGSYGLWRFLIEFVRDDYRGSFVTGLSPSQMQSLVLVAVAVPTFFLLRYFNQKLTAHELVLEAEAEKMAAQIMQEENIVEEIAQEATIQESEQKQDNTTTENGGEE